MDNIIVSKTYHQDNLIQLKVEAKSQYVSMWQDCFIEDINLKNNIDELLNFIKNKKETYLEFGVKTGNYTPAFSMQLNSDKLGHIQIELDMEIPDNNTRKHRCMFFIKTEEGLLENFANKLKGLLNEKNNEPVLLSDTECANLKSLS